MPERDLVFFSYKHEDGRWLAPIRGALEPYVLDSKLILWSDQEIEAGRRWENEIQHALACTRVGVLFISQRFFASRYIFEKELPRLLADSDADLLDLICVPVGEVDPQLLRDCKLNEYQFAFPITTPISARRGRQREKAIVETAIRVKDAYRRRGPAVPEVVKPPPAYRGAAPLILAAPEKSRALDEDPGRLGQLVGVPLDEPHYVDRPDALVRLKERVLQGTELAAGITSANRSGRVGLHGMGGMGKTVLAQGFCHDAQVRRAFPDGIYWITIGQQPGLLAQQTSLLQMLGESAMAESISRARELLRARLAGKRVLLVIDDLWHAEHFQPFDIVTGMSRVLITTRDAGVLTLVGAREEPLAKFDAGQAQRLLVQWAGIEAQDLPSSAARVAELCDYLPLALALAGAQIADGVQWSTLIGELERGRVEFLDHDYGSVFHSLGRSVDALSEAERARYLELAVFPEDAQIPLETIARLWKHSGGLSAADSEKLLGRFQRKALLKVLDAGAGAFVTFHDLQRDFVRIRAESPRVLSALLLDAYRATLGLREEAAGWAAMPRDEPYLWSRLAFHLVEAERRHEVRALLLSMAWIRARLDASTRARGDSRTADVNALLSDYEFSRDVPDVVLVQRALRMSMHIVGAHPEQASAQLFGRLGTNMTPSTHQLCWEALKEIRTVPLAPERPALSPPGALVLTLTGHESVVRGTVLLADRRRALSWSDDATLRLWDLERGEALHKLTGHTARVDGALLLADGRRALSWSDDGTLKLWDLERGEALHTLTGHDARVDGALLLADGRRALSWSYDRTLRVWDLVRGEALQMLIGHEGGVYGAVVLADGRRALSWSYDRTLRVWDLVRGEALHTLTGHGGEVYCGAAFGRAARAVVVG
jgi:hypothetical protein